MDVPTRAADFREGSGRLCLDFIRTLRHRGSPEATEELPSRVELDEWVRHFSPCPPSPGNPGSDHSEMARVLRESVYAMISAAQGTGGLTSCPATARATVNRAAGFAVPAPHLTSSGELRHHADEPVLAALALVARDALDLVTSPAIDRVHECANPNCMALFFDGSRPGTRRWCSMSTCGNLAKKATLRASRSAP